MIKAIKHFIHQLIAPMLYFGGIWLLFVTMFKRAELGLLLLVFIIPLPNVYYKLHVYPLGHMFIDLYLLAIFIGCYFQKLQNEKSGNEKWIITLIVITYLTVWECSFNYSLPLPLTTSNEVFIEWKNYIRTFLLYFLIVKIIKEKKQQKVVVLLICFSLLLISIKAYRNFSGGASFNWDKRVGGPFEAVGLGANHFGAFIADYCSVVLGLFFYDTNKYRKILYLTTILFSLHPLLYSYSRAAYIAFFVSVLFFAIMKERKLFILLILLTIAWNFILPESVVDRINMTSSSQGELDASSESRIELWQVAYDMFKKSPLNGNGFGSFGLTVKFNASNSGTILNDTHNFFIRVLCEQGIIGLLLLLIVFSRAFKSGISLTKKSKMGFEKGLGMGFSAGVISIVITNFFGDRFSYLVSGAYFWILWGVVDGMLINKRRKDCEEKDVIYPSLLEKVIKVFN